MIDPINIEKRDRIIDEVHKTIKMCIPEDQDAPWAVDGQIETISDMIDEALLHSFQRGSLSNPDG